MIYFILLIIGIILYKYHSKKPIFPKSNEFILKIEPALFSSDYIRYRYSINGGFTWKSVCAASSPLFGGENWTWGEINHKLGNGNFDHEKQKFSSYEKIKEFEKEQTKIYNNGREKIEKNRIKAQEDKQKAYERANSNLKT